MRFLIKIKTKGFNEVVDITSKLREVIKNSGVREGICLIFSPGSTCGITTIEYEQGLIKDFKNVLDKIVPVSDEYEHCRKWGDCNGYAHIRSALVKPFLVLPLEEGDLFLGTWQQVVFIDFDNRPREREIFVKVVGQRYK